LSDVLRHLGRRAEAEACYREGLALVERLVGDNPANSGYRGELGKCHYHLGVHYAEADRRPEAEAAFRAALDIQKKLVADYPENLGHRAQLSFCHYSLAHLLVAGRRPGEAEAHYREAVALQWQLVAQCPAVPDHWLALGRSLNNLGGLLEVTGRRPAAGRASPEARGGPKRVGR